MSLSLRRIAKNLSLIENRKSGYKDFIDSFYPSVGKAWRIGVTGPPGAGKSTLINRLIELFRKDDQKVAVLAVDPSSPFKGGAFLGDRIRMEQWAADPDVFIRSCASRGSDGGLSEQAGLMSDYLDASGYDVIINETLGVGQAEIDVTRNADTVLVILTPQSGDGIQALKTGLMEIADVFSINKSDQPGSAELKHSLRSAIELRSSEDKMPSIVKTIAIGPDLPEELYKELLLHKSNIQSSKTWDHLRRERRRSLIKSLVRQSLEQDFWSPSKEELLSKKLNAIESEGGPFSIALDFVNQT